MILKFLDDFWEQRKLGKICNTYSGGTPSVTDSSYYNGNIPFIRSAEINSETTELFLTKSGLKNSSAKLVEKGSILYAMYGATSGEVGISKINGAINQAILAIHPHENYNSYFIMQWLRLNKEQIISTYLQGGQGNLSGSIIKSLKIEFPNSNEQQIIGDFFNLLDKNIDLHQRKLDQLNQLKESLLQQMFPGKGETVPKLRFAGFEGEWEERKLGSIYDFSKGKGLPLNSFTYSKDDPAIAYGHLYTKYSEVISEVNLSSDDDGVLSKENDLLFPGSSTVPNGTAQANAIMLNNVKLGGDIIIARPKQDIRVLSIFMSYHINSQRQKLFPITVGTTIAHMYGKDLSKVKFFITNYSEQEKISYVFKQLDNTITLHQRKIDSLKELKNSSLQLLFV
ncbi:restriction endonuclease subunit S [Ruoffia sp. FAM 20858]|uniref:restriction endonuclease subunit S n=1 Tax=Ruoffia sp. FAM 20858 TaxID=3259516 RepID=UPI00388E15B2